MQKSQRLNREIKRLLEHPPEGISCYTSDKLNYLSVNIIGPHGSLFAGSLFKLDLEIPSRYPFVPPRLKFVTPVYHPNIDTQGRICMDLLKMPPNGGWRPTISLENLIVAVQSLLCNPNPDDPLMVDIAEEYRFNKKEYERKAKKLLLEYERSND
ncbi:PREDICTED: ubiquitin-conjugating enzyme E2 T-like [Ceratosolen solmsi marchali]|uniref:Ubiquitin-conjugating enzyme E2 T-like n=1 Tax=Ceratosolen solmsi marchali TaxID=326594 RepID=A0AAJ6VMW0_9HYME|nr:PREDICTED: ubiquitin-conjugating enzyme E2 T-like [Ceratosolen solmsi marchali]